MTTPRQHLLLLTAIAALTLIGSVNLYSAVQLWGGGVHGRLWHQHLIWIGAGLLLLWGLSRVDYRFWRVAAPSLQIGVAGLLGLVLLVGREVGGNRSWLGVGGFGVQPSEFAKWTSVLILARFFSESIATGGYGPRALWRPALWVGVPTLLIIGQRDLGTTLFMGLLTLSLGAFVRLRWTTWVLLIALAAGGSTLAYYRFLGPAQRARLHTFLAPEDDPRGRGYQLLQARLAVGSGQWWGRGYRQGQVNKLRFLPEKHTDFVFPVLAEEWGFVGGSLVLALYGVVLLATMNIARQARDRFGALLASGAVFWCLWQIAINLGGVLGLIPLTGITLPFLSYGGSSTLMTFATFGVVLNIYRRRFLF